MNRLLLVTTIAFLYFGTLLNAQNVFNPTDPIIRYNPTAPVGSVEKPNPDLPGLQKWVTDVTIGVSTGSGSFDASSYKSYFINYNGNKMSFRLKFPKSYNNPDSISKKYPMMMFLHGAGEVACPSNGGLYNNEKQLLHGGELFRNRVDNNEFDGFLIYPQAYSASPGCWGDWGIAPYSPYYQLFINVVDSLAKYTRADADRLFVNGLSNGGKAAFSFATVYPKRVAATAPSAAATSDNNYSDFIHVPIWFASGSTDNNPTPGFAQATYSGIKNAGGNIVWTLFEGKGHAIWWDHWVMPGYTQFMQAHHKANPHVYFQRNEFCPDSAINARIGISPGYFAYEWQKDGASYPATGNEIVVNTYGTYRVRFKRSASDEWSVWSPRPAVIGQKGATQTPSITITGIHSNVLPAPDGSKTVPLELPAGFFSYQWVRANDNIVVGTQRTFNAPVGEYKAKTVEQFGCGSLFSPVFKVVDANGAPKPEAAKNLTALAQNQTSIRLDWSENPNPGTNETGFEIYRSNKPGGPYQLIDITPANVSTYLNTGLLSNQKYYYIVRAVNNTGAAAVSNEATATSMVDSKPPTAPQNLLYRGSSQSSVDLAWTASTDDVAVDRYDVFVNGVKMYTTSNTYVTVAGLKPDQLYTFTVKARDAAGNLSAPSNQESGYTHSQGIAYKYYQGSWTSLPDFATLTPVKTGVMDNVTNGLGIRTVIENYAFLWEGYIFIPVTGSYTFETDSDDGSKLYIDQNYSHTATPLVNNDGVHGPQFRTGTITLSRGYHRFVATFFEASGGEVMDVWWSGPGIAREKLPKNYLSTNTFTLGAVPATPTGLTGNTPQFNRVNLSWTHAGTNTTGYEILRSTGSGSFAPVGTVPVAQKTFVDTSVNASTAYSYRVRAINSNGSSDVSNTFTITTAGAPAAPAAPTSLSALLVGKTSVQLTWTDNSTNETAFEVERSVGNNANFRLLKIVPGGAGSQKTFTDTGLFANVTYFYRVRAIGSSNSSVYTNQVSARTLNTKPEFVNPKDFTMKIRTTYTLPVVVNDVDGDPLTFTITGMPSFGSMQTVSNGKVNLVFNASISSAGSYPMIMYVNDGNNGRDTAYFTMVVNQNSVPTMTPLSNVSMNEGESRTLSLVANDAEGNASIFWTFTDKPSFVTFTNNGNGRGSLQINPGYSNSGIYNMTVFADDGYGAWTSSNFSIEVKEKDPNETVQVSVRYYSDPVPKWNGIDVRPELAKPFTVSNLKNTKDSSTTIGITALSSDYEGGSEGAQSFSNTGVFPNSVMKNQIRWGFFAGGNHRDLLTLRVTGLNVNKKYNFTFFGSSTCTGCQLTAASTTTYKIGNQSAAVNYFNNISQTATIYQVQPNGAGEILIDMTGDPNPTSGGVLNALVIDAQIDDGTTPVKPIDLEGTFVDNSGVQLSWTDASYNENAFQVYRSTTRNGSYTLVNPGMNNKDSVSFTDVTTSPFTQYYYYVAGVNNAGVGVSSDTVSVLTGNNKPRISGLANMYVKTGGSVSDDFTVTDDAGDVVTVSIVNRPGYITLTSLGGNNYRITATPTIDDIDWHKVTIKAEDNKGGVTTQDIILTVSENGIRFVYVNFGNFGKVAPEPWNNKIGYAEIGSQITALKDETNTPTSFAIQFVNKWEGLTDIGQISGNETGVYPDAVLQSGIWDSSSAARTILFSGLDPAKRYNLVFVGSQNEGIDATTIFSVAGQTSTINARYNTNKTANLNNLTPNSSGQITVNVTRGSAYKMYLNGLHIEEFAPTGTTMNPMNLYVEPRDRTSILLSWSDRSNNETGFTLQRATDSLFTANVITLNYAANLTSSSITGLTPNTKYWFRVRPTNNATGWSNRICTITPDQVVSVNFNFTVQNAPWPWNNTQTQPNLPESFNNLIDHAGNNSGISMKIEKIFNGEFNAGMNTGNNSGIVPDNVLRGNYWLDNGQQSAIRVSGLNQTKRYRFGFIGSSSPDGWFAGDYTATYTINGRTVYLNSWRNTTEIVYMGNVLADSNGEVLITFSTTAAALYAFNAGVIIQSYDDPRGGAVLNGEILPPSEITLPPTTVAVGETVVAETVSDWKVNMYPNPFTDHLNIGFHNTNASNNLSVEVLDLTGKLIHRRVYGKVSQGYITLRMNASEGNIGTGVYLVVLKANGKSVSSGKLIRTRQ